MSDTTMSLPQLCPLHIEAEQTLRLISVVKEHLAGLQQRGRVQAAMAVLEIMERDLTRALAAHSTEAARDLRETVLTALGPDLRYGEVEATKKALRLVLDCLP